MPNRNSSRYHRQSGVTLIEMMVTLTIISILAAGILPLSQMAYKRGKEIELRSALRIIRKALDDYYTLYQDGKIKLDSGASGYPKDLDLLVNGFMLKDGKTRKKLLRRLPPDPFTETGEWGRRSYSDDAGSRIWGGQDVYDIYSKSDRMALDGTYYKNW